MFDFSLATYSSLLHPASLTCTAVTPAMGLALVCAAKPRSITNFIRLFIDYALHLCLLAALPMGLVWVSVGMFAMLSKHGSNVSVEAMSGNAGYMLITGVMAGVLFGVAVVGRNQNVRINVPRLPNKSILLVLIFLLSMHHYTTFMGGINFTDLYNIDLAGMPLLFLFVFFGLAYFRTQNAATALEHSSALVTCLVVVVALIFWFFASSAGTPIVGISRLDAVMFATLNIQWGCLLFAVSQIMKLGPYYEDREYEIPEALKYLVEACTFFIFLVFTPGF